MSEETEITVTVDASMARLIEIQKSIGTSPSTLINMALFDYARRYNLIHLVLQPGKKESDPAREVEAAPNELFVEDQTWQPKGTAEIQSASYMSFCARIVLQVAVKGIGLRRLSLPTGGNDARLVLARYVDVTGVENYGHLIGRQVTVENTREKLWHLVELPPEQIEAALAELKARGIE